jgi:hypothetical protein
MPERDAEADVTARELRKKIDKHGSERLCKRSCFLAQPLASQELFSLPRE